MVTMAESSLNDSIMTSSSNNSMPAAPVMDDTVAASTAAAETEQQQQQPLSRTRTDTEDTESLLASHRSLLDDDDEEEEEEPSSSKNNKKNSSAVPGVLVDDDENAAPNAANTITQQIVTKAVRNNSNNNRRATSASLASLFQNSVSHSNTLRRHTISQQPPPPPHVVQQVVVHRWDGFVRRGTRLKTLLEDAMSEVQTSIRAQKRGRDELLEEEQEGNDNGVRNPKNPRVVQVADFSAQLARDKTTQVMQLERQLKDAQAQASAMQAANLSLREETATGQSRLDRTVEALRIAGSNAAKARADADAAEATAATLAQTLQSLQSVISETKRAAQILAREQQQVASTAANAEAKLLQKEGDLSRALKELATVRQNNAVLENSHDAWNESREHLERLVKEHQQDLVTLKREATEQAAVEQARKDRADKVELEWRRAQAMLVEATSGQAAAEQTQAVLEETIASLQKSNQDLHRMLSEQQDTSRSDVTRLSEALRKAEKEAQKYRIQGEAAQEEMHRLKQDKLGAEKQIIQLKSRLSKAERNVVQQENSAAASAAGSGSNNNVSPEVAAAATPNASALSFHLPPLSNTAKSSTSSTPGANTNSTTIANTTTELDKQNDKVCQGLNCCVCFKAVSGLMKTCQCGKTDCKLRAHINCAKLSVPGPSISHPGTPAPRLPTILCASVSAKILSSQRPHRTMEDEEE